MNCMDTLSREGEDMLELFDGVFPPLEAQVQETAIVEVGHNVHGGSGLRKGNHWMLNDSEGVLVALCLQAELCELPVE